MKRKRKQYSGAFKAKVGREALMGMKTTAQIARESQVQGPFSSLTDFFMCVQPTTEEMESLIRAGTFDEFGDKRTEQFRQAQYLAEKFSGSTQTWLIPPDDPSKLSRLPLMEPNRMNHASLTDAQLPRPWLIISPRWPSQSHLQI